MTNPRATLQYIVKHAIERYHGVSIAQGMSIDLRRDCCRVVLRIPGGDPELWEIEFELAPNAALGRLLRCGDRAEFVDGVASAVESLIERVYADRHALELRQLKNPEWSPYP